MRFRLALSHGRRCAGPGGRTPDRRRAVHLPGLLSCPPADALLAELASRPEVLALSFHVDYWDRLGWKDPFSSPDATRRQNGYAELLGLATVYTPQMVVDGKWQAVGSDRGEVERALEPARRDRDEVPVALAVDHGRAQIRLGSGWGGDLGGLLLIGFDRRHVTAVARGENSGRTLAHVDVVRSIEEVAEIRRRENGVSRCRIRSSSVTASPRSCRLGTAGLSESPSATPIPSDRLGSTYCTVSPPSTTGPAPVMKAASSEARKTMPLAMSTWSRMTIVVKITRGDTVSRQTGFPKV